MLEVGITAVQKVDPISIIWAGLCGALMYKCMKKREDKRVCDTDLFVARRHLPMNIEASMMNTSLHAPLGFIPPKK